MRRFIFNDEEFDVKVTVDIPEPMWEQLRATKQKVRDTIKKLAIFTMDKEEPNEPESE
jgi:hypothetical protein